MKKSIVLLTALAVLCTLCACKAAKPGSSLNEGLSEAGSAAENLLSEAGEMMTELVSAVGSDGSSEPFLSSGHSDNENRGPASLSFRYVTLEIPEGMSYELQDTTDAGDVHVTLYGMDTMEEMTFFLTESRSVSSTEVAVTECVRRNADAEGGDVRYGDDVAFGDVTYKSVHIVHADGSATDYLAGFLTAEDGTGLYVEMKTAEYPTGSAVMPLEDPLAVAFLKGIRYN